MRGTIAALEGLWSRRLFREWRALSGHSPDPATMLALNTAIWPSSVGLLQQNIYPRWRRWIYTNAYTIKCLHPPSHLLFLPFPAAHHALLCTLVAQPPTTPLASYDPASRFAASRCRTCLTPTTKHQTHIQPQSTLSFINKSAESKKFS